jgi:hypothetical protein
MAVHWADYWAEPLAGTSDVKMAEHLAGMKAASMAGRTAANWAEHWVGAMAAMKAQQSVDYLVACLVVCSDAQSATMLAESWAELKVVNSEL